MNKKVSMKKNNKVNKYNDVNKNNKNKKSSNVKQFFITMTIAFFISLFLFVGGVFAWFHFSESVVPLAGETNPDGSGEQTTLLEEKMSIPRKTNFLIAGVDQTELLTDVILVGNFDSETKQITLISIPRDTYVVMSDELRAEAKADGIYMPSQFKINAINSYSGAEKGIIYLQKYLEEMMGINIDFYAELDTDAFVEIVDIIGGVEMEIRPKGFHYYDPTQNLTIDVPGGMQLLDGEKAEGVVRFRADYVQGDIDRISVQQEFMKAFFSQVISKEAIRENALSYIEACFKYLRTDFPISEIPRYLPYLEYLSADSITFVTLPGESQTIGGASYYVADNTDVTQLVNWVFFGDGIPKESEALKGKTIQILNGSNVAGLASAKRETLENEGIKVESVSNYKGEPLSNTTIYSKDGIDTSELDEYFTNPVTDIIDPSMGNYDIVIVLGENEQ